MYNLNMSSTSQLISVEEYLKASYDPDREYVDGVVVERNSGEKDHSRTQRELIRFFLALEPRGRFHVFPEQRVQVNASRFRIPDVCVCLDREPEDRIFRTPPFLAIEILSPDDRASDLQEKLEDYLSFGVPFVWVIDPRRRPGRVYTREASWDARAGTLWADNPDVRLPLAAIFA
jgi:Uma2 family endonuclease